MSTATMSAARAGAERDRPAATGAPGERGRRRIFWTGTLLGGTLALLAGALLASELQTLGVLFVPLSALAGGRAALAAWMHFAGLADEGARMRRERAAFAALALGAILLLFLYGAFVERVDFANGTKSVAYIKGWQRAHTEIAGCEGINDNACIQRLGLGSMNEIRSAWHGRQVVQIAMALSYLFTLGSLAALVGMLRAPAGAPPAAPKGYLDFDLWIDQKADTTYRAKAWSAAGFEATVGFSLPPALAAGEPCRFGFSGPSRGEPAAGAATSFTPEEVGDALFQAIFQGDLLKSFQGCLEQAKDGPGLRIRLRLNDVPALACLPWEYLYQAKGRGFLALSARTPVVRYLELSEPIETLRVEPPLRVLAVISTPKEYQELAEADEEWRRLGAAVEPLADAGVIELERLEPPTREALDERLRTGGPVHVLHFVGHGGFSEMRGGGVLIFEDEEGRGAPVSGQSLAYLLQDHPSLRLAVLNACNGASASREDTFAGTAQVLVQHGVPAVVAMQSEVTDETACRFAEKFYCGLAEGLPVDACLGEVRKALAAESNPEWGTPALYLRAADGGLFAVQGARRRPKAGSASVTVGEALGQHSARRTDREVVEMK